MAILGLSLELFTEISIQGDMHVFIRDSSIPIGLMLLASLFFIRRGSRSSRFLIIGTLALLSFGIITEVHGMVDTLINDHMMESNIFIDFLRTKNSISYMQVGVMIEVLFLSIALSIRSKERLEGAQKESMEAKIKASQKEKEALRSQQQLIEVERDKAVLELQQAVAQQKILSSELVALKAQINPHFFGNALNAIKLLIQQAQYQKATTYLSKFGYLMRLVLEYSKEQLITLNRELEICEKYIEIEALRFEDQFTFHIQNLDASAIDDIKVPPLVLQPYIENALWHGLLTKEGDRQLIIKVEIHCDDIRCIIDDNGVGRVAARAIERQLKRQFPSRGLQITHDRLSLSNELYDTQYKIEIKDKITSDDSASGTQVILTIPK